MTSKKWIFCLTFGYFMLFLLSQNVSVADEYSQDLPEISEKLNTKINLDLAFTDDAGKTKTLADMFEGQETLIITLNYFRCTTMCTYQFLNLAETLKKANIEVGKGFTIASVSFDTTDDTFKAQTTRDIWLKKLGAENAPWHFYTTQNNNTITALTKSLNFYFEPDDENNFSHTAGLFFIQKDGTLKRYIYGIVYEPRDIKYALIDTGNTGSVFDKVSRKFYKYNASRGKYE